MRVRPILGAALLCALAAAMAALDGCGSAAPGEPAGGNGNGKGKDKGVCRVRRGRFELRVREAGEFRPLHCRVVIAREGGKVEWLAPEGSSVQVGELLFSQDRTSQNEWLTRDTIEMDAARRNLQEVRRQVDLEREAVKLGIKIKESAVKLAETRKAEVDAGATAEAVAEARAALDAARAQAGDKRAAADGDATLAAKGYLSAAEAALSRVSAEIAAAQMERAQLSLALLEAGATKEAREAARLTVARAGEDLAMTRADAEIKEAELAGRVADAQAQVAWLERSVENAKQAIANREVRADAAGVIIYRGIGRRQQEKIEVGLRIWPGAGVIDIADMGRMKVRTQLAERYIRHLTPGSMVKVSVEGSPGAELAAKVTWIDRWARDRSADLAKADREKEGLSGIKVFALEAELEGPDPRGRAGARCRVEFTLLEIPDARIVPRAALYGTGAARYVLAAGRSQPQRVAVEILAEDEREAAVRGELSEGQELVARGQP